MPATTVPYLKLKRKQKKNVQPMYNQNVQLTVVDDSRFALHVLSYRFFYDTALDCTWNVILCCCRSRIAQESIFEFTRCFSPIIWSHIQMCCSPVRQPSRLGVSQTPHTQCSHYVLFFLSVEYDNDKLLNDVTIYRNEGEDKAHTQFLILLGYDTRWNAVFAIVW